MTTTPATDRLDTALVADPRTLGRGGRRILEPAMVPARRLLGPLGHGALSDGSVRGLLPPRGHAAREPCRLVSRPPTSPDSARGSASWSAPAPALVGVGRRRGTGVEVSRQATALLTLVRRWGAELEGAAPASARPISRPSAGTCSTDWRASRASSLDRDPPGPAPRDRYRAGGGGLSPPRFTDRPVGGIQFPGARRGACRGRVILATLGVVHGSLLAPDEGGLSEAAWIRLEMTDAQPLTFAHPRPIESLSLVRAKIHGRPLTAGHFTAIVGDIAAGRFSDIELAAFLAGCAGGRLTDREVVDLTLAMIAAGDRLAWPRTPVMDKHSVGGLSRKSDLPHRRADRRRGRPAHAQDLLEGDHLTGGARGHHGDVGAGGARPRGHAPRRRARRRLPGVGWAGSPESGRRRIDPGGAAAGPTIRQLLAAVQEGGSTWRISGSRRSGSGRASSTPADRPTGTSIAPPLIRKA